MDFIYCRGGDKQIESVLGAGWHYGTRVDYTPYAPVYMLDVDFHSYLKLTTDTQREDWWQHYLSKVAALRPKMAMVVDYMEPAQRTTMYKQIRDLKALGVERIMVCPKFAGAIAHIPSWCIIAVSVPSTYAGYLPEPSELHGRRVHLLGGHPDQWAYLAKYRYPDAQIISADGNVLADKAKRGQYWDAAAGTWRDVRNQHETEALKRMSAESIRYYMAQPAPRIGAYKRVLRCQSALF